MLAVAVAVGIYFALQPYVGTEEIGWMCILGAAPFAACGFFTYHGMTAEQVLWAWFKSEILCPKRLVNPDDTRTPTGTLQWPLPVAGTITSQFGHRVDPITGEVSSHTGTDIACAEGTPILAAADGTLTVANGLDSWGGSYGYYIQIDHGGGLETL